MPTARLFQRNGGRRVDTTSEMDCEIGMPPPIVRAPAMPRRHRPMTQRRSAGSAARGMLVVIVVAAVCLLLLTSGCSGAPSHDAAAAAYPTPETIRASSWNDVVTVQGPDEYGVRCYVGPASYPHSPAIFCMKVTEVKR